VGTVEKSIAATASRWFRKNINQRSLDPLGLGARPTTNRETVASDRSKLSFINAPWRPEGRLASHRHKTELLVQGFASWSR
jgi:hypothetical protein